MENDQGATAPPTLSLTTAQLIEISLALPSVYVNNLVFASVQGGVKLTFVEVGQGSTLSPRVTVFLPTECVKELHMNLGESIRRREATASAPEAPTTRQ